MHKPWTTSARRKPALGETARDEEAGDTTNPTAPSQSNTESRLKTKRAEVHSLNQATEHSHEANSSGRACKPTLTLMMDELTEIEKAKEHSQTTT